MARITTILSLAVLWVAMPAPALAGQSPFELTVRQDRLFGSTPGTLVVTEDGVEFRAATPKVSRRWEYPALKQIRILSPTRITLDTYEDRDLLHLGTDRSYAFEVTGVIAGDLVAFLLARVERPIVTAVMPPLPSAPLFRALVKHARGGRGSEGALLFYDTGLAYTANRDDDARFWRFRDIFAVLALDPFRLQVLAYEGGSGETRPFTFDLKETLPAGMYDALWQRVNRPDRRPYSVGSKREATNMTRPMMATVLALAVAAGGGAASATQDPQHQHEAPAQAPDMIAMCQKMMADMHANTAKLVELTSKMNASSGQAKTIAAADLLTALVMERTAMEAAMRKMQAGGAMKDMQMSGGMQNMQMSDEMTAMHAAMSSNAPKPAESTAATPAVVDVAFRMQPDQPPSGENAALEVTLRTDKGQPVADATVTVTFYMPAMPGMGMPEMKSVATLEHDAGGVYRGTGQVPMAGRWEVTISAVRDGKELGNKKVTITAR